MKTEQEIEKLAQLIGHIKDDCENCDCKSCEVNGDDCGCVHYICATFLVDAGYGDVSEYKAEIKTLCDRNAELHDDLNKTAHDMTEKINKLKAERNALMSEKTDLDYVNFELSQENKVLKNDIKRAKIDVLNKAKERCDLIAEELEDECDHYGSSAAYSCTYEIKKLIEEVQNAEDKG